MSTDKNCCHRAEYRVVNVSIRGNVGGNVSPENISVPWSCYQKLLQ